MDEIWSNVIKWAVPFVLGSLVTAIVGLYRSSRALKMGVQALLRDRIIQAYNHYRDKGEYPIYARQNVESLYKQYHALGGNGVVTGLVRTLDDLPTERGGGGGAVAG